MLFFFDRRSTMKDRLLCLLAAGISFVLVFSRRPGAIFLPQFWAEDGRVWYADAYNRGIHSLFSPEAGYFQTFSRLIALLSQAASLSSAPLLFNVSAIAVQALVAAFIVSSRFSRVIADQRWRVAAAFLYVAMPHSWEVNANLTNSQWHLGLLSLLILLSTPGEGRFARVFDVVALVVSALSGPLCLLLLPIVGLQYYRLRERRLLLYAAILTVGATMQLLSLVTHDRPPQAELGTSILLFFEIAGRHLFASPIIGGTGFTAIASRGSVEAVILTIANIAGFAFAAYILIKAKGEIRLLLVFTGLIFIAALASPAVSATDPQWQVMVSYDTALRYWFIPSFCLYVTLIYFASAPGARIRVPAIAILVASLFGIGMDWKNPPFQDLKFYSYADEFEKAPPGTVFEIPINPPPDWKMTLVKKP